MYRENLIDRPTTAAASRQQRRQQLLLLLLPGDYCCFTATLDIEAR
jgi:hypothetical protein